MASDSFGNNMVNIIAVIIIDCNCSSKLHRGIIFICSGKCSTSICLESTRQPELRKDAELMGRSRCGRQWRKSRRRASSILRARRQDGPWRAARPSKGLKASGPRTTLAAYRQSAARASLSGCPSRWRRGPASWRRGPAILALAATSVWRREEPNAGAG